MTATARLDTEIVRRGLAKSRTRAAALVGEGKVTVDGTVARRSSQPVAASAEILVTGHGDDVSRGARKLTGALDDLARLAPGALDPHGARCLDAGASTGGFTQVLLRHGAAHVLAVDVGHGQLDPVVGDDPRVTAAEGVNVRDLDLEALGVAEPVDLVVADLSFISLRTAAAALVRATRPGGDLLLLVKPQFEVGRRRLGRGGVVTSPELRTEAVTAVAATLADLGARPRAVLPSGLAGESGNREYFLWATCAGSDAPPPVSGALPTGRDEDVRRAVLTGEAVLLPEAPTLDATAPRERGHA